MNFLVSKKLRVLSAVVSLVICFQLVACGTILYPERRGQRGGQIDPAVAIMDGLGLLLWILPGVVAFAVDFSTGAIYLPGGGRSSVPSDKGLIKISVDPDGLTIERVIRIVEAETGKKIIADDASVFKVKGNNISGIADMIVKGRVTDLSGLEPVDMLAFAPQTHAAH